jgi:hypothetical protein
MIFLLTDIELTCCYLVIDGGIMMIWFRLVVAFVCLFVRHDNIFLANSKHHDAAWAKASVVKHV